MIKKIVAQLTCMIIVLNLVTPAFAVEDRTVTLSGITESELEVFVDNYVDTYIGVSTAGASVAIWYDGEVVLSKAYGLMDVSSDAPVNENTVLEWGSATKLLVWTSIMQLSEKGLLDMDADIRTYLPEGFFKKLAYDTPITIYNLMHHNAGWEEVYTDLIYSSSEAISSLEEHLHISEPSQINEPGTVMAYSNYGVALAGYLVELASGQPFYEYVQEHIFSVLSMTETAVHPTQADNTFVKAKRDEIKGHSHANGKLAVSSGERVYFGLYPAGSAIGTSSDAIKFLVALMPNEGETSPLFTSNDTLEEMLSTSYYSGEDVAVNAHGFWENLYSVRTIGHGGNTESFSSNFTLSPDSRFAVVVMTNQANETGLCGGLTEALYGKYEIEYSGTLPDAALLEGTYIMARRPYTGFTKVAGLIRIADVTVINNTQIQVLGSTFTQVSPYLYRNDDSDGQLGSLSFLYFTVEDGVVERISAMSTDLMPADSFVPLLILSGILLALCLLFLVTSLFIHLIGGIRNRKKGVSSTLAKKLNLGLTLAVLVAMTNSIIMIIRAITFVSYSEVLVQFGINIVYMLIAVVTPFLLLWAGKKVDLTKRQKLFYFFNCLFAIILAALLFGWEFIR